MKIDKHWTGVEATAVEMYARPRFAAEANCGEPGAGEHTGAVGHGGCLAIAIAFFGLFGFVFMVTQYFQFICGYDPLSAGVKCGLDCFRVGVGFLKVEMEVLPIFERADFQPLR